MKLFIFSTFIALSSGAISSTSNKYDTTNGGFLPSPRYYNDGENRTESLKHQNRIAESKVGKGDGDGDDRLQRFGPSGYGGGGTGYPNSGTGITTYPMKIDLGGVVLGTLIGLGAILIIPKLAHVFSSAGGYRRSIENEMDFVTDLLTKIDKSLGERHIDSSVCMQRAICSYVQESQKNIAAGQPNMLDNFVYTLTNNTMVSFLLDGTAIQQAFKLGKENDPESCSSLYTKCPVSRKNIMQIITNILPA